MQTTTSPLVSTPMIGDRLETIAKRQRGGRKHDLLFACFVVLAATLGATAVGTAVRAAAPADVACAASP